MQSQMTLNAIANHFELQCQSNTFDASVLQHLSLLFAKYLEFARQLILHRLAVPIIAHRSHKPPSNRARSELGFFKFAVDRRLQ